MEKHNVDFHVAEYNNIKTEISANNGHLYNIIIYVSAANAFVVTWMMQSLSQYKDMASRLISMISWIPFVLTLSAFLLCMVLRSNNRRLFAYCLDLEKIFAFGNLGLERNYADKKRRHVISTYRVFNVIFLLQSALSIYFIYFVNYKH